MTSNGKQTVELPTPLADAVNKFLCAVDGVRKRCETNTLRLQGNITSGRVVNAKIQTDESMEVREPG